MNKRKLKEINNSLLGTNTFTDVSISNGHVAGYIELKKRLRKK